MTVELNHTIIPARDKWTSAKFLADILNLEAGPEWGHFVPVCTGNGVTLDYSDSLDFRPQHYAFLVSEAEFDAALSRIRAAVSRTTRIFAANCPVRSTTSMAAAASISTTRVVICSNSSPVLTARSPKGRKSGGSDQQSVAPIGRGQPSLLQQ